jgi:hypothetical protein
MKHLVTILAALLLITPATLLAAERNPKAGL